jgi:hypothetical protein
MALGTGAIDWLSISREFGGSVAGAGTNIVMTTYYAATANISASGAINSAQFKGQTGLAADLGASKTLTTTGAAGTFHISEVNMYSNGVCIMRDTASGVTTIRYNFTWKTGYGAASLYDVQMNLSSGTYWSTGTSPVGSGNKYSMGTAINFYMLFNTAGNRNGVFDMRILANNDARVLSSMTLTHNYNIT